MFSFSNLWPVWGQFVGNQMLLVPVVVIQFLMQQFFSTCPLSDICILLWQLFLLTTKHHSFPQQMMQKKFTEQRTVALNFNTTQNEDIWAGLTSSNRNLHSITKSSGTNFSSQDKMTELDIFCCLFLFHYFIIFQLTRQNCRTVYALHSA